MQVIILLQIYNFLLYFDVVFISGKFGSLSVFLDWEPSLFKGIAVDTSSSASLEWSKLENLDLHYGWASCIIARSSLGQSWKQAQYSLALVMNITRIVGRKCLFPLLQTVTATSQDYVTRRAGIAIGLLAVDVDAWCRPLITPGCSSTQHPSSRYCRAVSRPVISWTLGKELQQLRSR